MEHSKSFPPSLFLQGLDVHEILPQQEPFVMVGCLLAVDDTSVSTQLLIAPDNILVDDGCFTTAGLIENMAQSLALRIGVINKYVVQKPISLGVLGAVSGLTVHFLPRVGDIITTTVLIDGEAFGMTSCSARVEMQGRLVAEARIKTAN